MAAIGYRAVPRETVDLDFVVDRLDELPTSLGARGLRFRLLRESDGDPYLLQGETPDGMHFDIYVAGTDFERAALDRSKEHVASAEDIIVYKLLADRPHDRDDIDQILTAHPEVDRRYVASWADEWEVTERWHEALARQPAAPGS